MIDFDDVLSYVRMYYRVAIGIAVIAALVLVFWLFKGYGGREEVKQVITEIQRAVETNERRTDAIIEAEKTKEAMAGEEIKKTVDTASDDALPDMLAGLLSDYRGRR